jgi:hypothetical protein
MTKVEDIAKAVSALAPAELAKFRTWFDAFDSERFDQRIVRDAKAGKLDRLAEAALADLKAGRVRDL